MSKERGQNTLDDFGKDIETKTPSSGEGRLKKVEEAETPLTSSDEKVFDGEAYCQWAEGKPRLYIPVAQTCKSLKAGVYSPCYFNGTWGLLRETMKFDEIIEFKDSIADRMIKEIEVFWKTEHLFKEHGFCQKMGYLIYGPAGQGKSYLVYMVIKQIINQNGIVVLCKQGPASVANSLYNFRMVEPERKIAVIFEDVDSTISEYGDRELLSFLDGEVQLEKILNIATTNYPEKLDRRIVARPRRFDRLIKIEAPDENIRRDFLQKKLKIENKELEKWVEATKGFSFAGLTDAVISVKCLQNDFDSTIEKLRKLFHTKISSSDFENKIGIRRE